MATFVIIMISLYKLHEEIEKTIQKKKIDELYGNSKPTPKDN